MKLGGHLSAGDQASYRCCFCCHVKTGTLIFGLFCATIQLICLGFLVLAAIRPDVLIPDNRQAYDGIIVVQTEDGQVFQDFDAVNKQVKKDNLYMLFGVTIVSFIATVALIYGVAKNVASYLMPFFCLQIFELCLSAMSLFGFFSYAPNIKGWIHDQGLENNPLMSKLMCMDEDYLMLLVATGLMLGISVKIYLMGMVWSCYKYIKMYVASRSVTREYTVDPDTEMLLPPRYEDVIKVPSNSPQPPVYSSE